jgi:serine/threonine protein kinase
LSSFLEDMLKWKPKDRKSARDLLSHPWLNMEDEYNVWMSKAHLKEFKLTNQKKFPGYMEELRKEQIKEQEEAMK